MEQVIGLVWVVFTRCLLFDIVCSIVVVVGKRLVLWVAFVGTVLVLFDVL